MADQVKSNCGKGVGAGELAGGGGLLRETDQVKISFGKLPRCPCRRSRSGWKVLSVSYLGVIAIVSRT